MLAGGVRRKVIVPPGNGLIACITSDLPDVTRQLYAAVPTARHPAYCPTTTAGEGVIVTSAATPGGRPSTPYSMVATVPW